MYDGSLAQRAQGQQSILRNIPGVLSPMRSMRVYFSNKCSAPNIQTNTGDTIVMKAAETNLLLMVSG